MPHPIRAIDVYLPLDYNDGEAVDESEFVQVQQELLHHFGGITSTRREFPLQGLWEHESAVYQDRVVVISAMDGRTGTPLETYRYLSRLKTKLKRRFKQLEILITVQEMLAI